MTRTPWGNSEEQSSRRLPPGPATPADEVLRNQRERLLAAMVGAIASNGYEATRVADLLEISGVSRSDFYEHFGNKSACFLATFDAIADIAARAIAAARDADSSWEQRLRAVLDTVVALAEDQPAAARLVLVDAYAAGPEAVARLDRATAAAERLLAELLAESPERAGMPEEIVRALVGGITTTMRRRLARDREGDLQALVPELLDWALGYRPPPQRLRSPRAAAPAKSARSEPGGQEQRLLAALAGALVEDGYAGTTITGVARRAGVSLTTFYAFFENKHEALLAVLDYVREASAAAVADGWDDSESWPEGVRAALDSLFHTFDDRPVLARVGALEPGLDDPRVRDHGIETLALEAVLAPGRHDAPVVQRTSAEAIGGGILALIDRQARNRQRHPLRALTPVATYVALAPFVGSGEACLVANGP